MPRPQAECYNTHVPSTPAGTSHLCLSFDRCTMKVSESEEEKKRKKNPTTSIFVRHNSVSVVGLLSKRVTADDEQTNDAESTVVAACNLTPQVRRAGKRGIDISVGAVGFLQVSATDHSTRRTGTV